MCTESRRGGAGARALVSVGLLFARLVCACAAYSAVYPSLMCAPLRSSFVCALRSSMEATLTDFGPLVILGQPFFRAYATQFNRATFEIAVAAFDADTHLCDSCGTAAAASRRERTLAATATRQRDGGSAMAPTAPGAGTHSKQGSLQPQRLPAQLLASDGGPEDTPSAAAPAASSKRQRALALGDVRLPWYAVRPSLRTPRSWDELDPSATAATPRGPVPHKVVGAAKRPPQSASPPAGDSVSERDAGAAGRAYSFSEVGGSWRLLL